MNSDGSPPVESNRVGLAVLGMHRSGTSALTRVLNLLGCQLPDMLVGPGVGNEVGHWEPEAIVAFDDSLLASAGSRWDDWQPFNDRWSRSVLLAPYHQRARELLRREYPSAPLFVIKDPRISRLAGFWFDVLAAENVDCRVIVAVRSPGDVASSLEERDAMQRGYAFLLWLRHSLDAEFGSRGRPRAFCTYDGLLRDWRGTIAHLEERLGVVFPSNSTLIQAEIDRFLDDGHRHFADTPRSAPEQEEVHAWAENVYNILARWSRDGENQADHPLLDEIRQKFDIASEAFSQLYVSGSASAGNAGAGVARRLALEAEVSEARSEIARQEEAVANAQALLAQGDNLQRQREDEIAQIRALLDEEQARRADVERAHAVLAGELTEAVGKNVSLERQLEDAVATVSLQEAERAKRAEGYAWLQSIGAAMMSAPTWWQYLPFKWSARQIIRRIYRQGLFDPDRYRELHPDVRDGGMDPLRHYMLYGLAEGRDRG